MTKVLKKARKKHINLTIPQKVRDEAGRVAAKNGESLSGMVERLLREEVRQTTGRELGAGNAGTSVQAIIQDLPSGRIQRTSTSRRPSSAEG